MEFFRSPRVCIKDASYILQASFFVWRQTLSGIVTLLTVRPYQQSQAQQTFKNGVVAFSFVERVDLRHGSRPKQIPGYSPRTSPRPRRALYTSCGFRFAAFVVRVKSFRIYRYYSASGAMYLLVIDVHRPRSVKYSTSAQGG